MTEVQRVTYFVEAQRIQWFWLVMRLDLETKKTMEEWKPMQNRSRMSKKLMDGWNKVGLQEIKGTRLGRKSTLYQ